MPRLITNLLLLFFLAGCSKPPLTSDLAILHATVIDATGSSPRSDTTVVILNKKIVAIGPAGTISVPPGTPTLDATGKFLIPGLVDSHVHLTAAGEPSGSREFIIPLLVANGITTVRDMGGKVEFLKQLRKEIESDRLLGPQIFFTGPYLDGDPPSFQPSIVVTNSAEAARAVDLLTDEGVDFIKTQSRLDRDAYFAIAAESRKKDIRFLGHVPDRVSALEASEAGQASIEHLTGVLLACSSQENELRAAQAAPPPPHETPGHAHARERVWLRKLLDTQSAEKTSALISAFVAHNTWQVPTFPTLVHLGYITPKTNLASDPRMKFVPQDEKKSWQQGIAAQLSGQCGADFAIREEIIRRSLAIVGKMQQAGVRIMAGTDLPAPNVFPGSSLHEDLAYLVEAGLTPMQALQAATRNPAEFLGKLQSEGTIEAGKSADLVLLDANPLDDIHNTQKIRAVILRGRLLDRPALDALLMSVERFAAQ
ncbi:MAG: amidohydrolase family protein [Candidatus Acidiferrum sp.]